MTLLGAFGATRVMIGTLAWVSPTFTHKLFGMYPAIDKNKDQGATLVTRLFGIREICLGYFLAFGDQSPPVLKQWLLMNIICDVADAGACTLAHFSGAGTNTRFNILVWAGAVAFAGIGVFFYNGIQ